MALFIYLFDMSIRTFNVKRGNVNGIIVLVSGGVGFLLDLITLHGRVFRLFCHS